MRRCDIKIWALLATTNLTSVAFAQKPIYAGIYAQSVTSSNNLRLKTGAFNQGTSAFNNPFVTGVMLTTTWGSIEPLPPGVNFCGGSALCSGAVTLTVAANGGSTTATITCNDANHSYCWDTIDRQLDLINPNANGTTTLSIGLDIHAGYHSPAWLSNDLITVNLDTDMTNVDQAGAAIYFTGNEVAAAQPPPSGTGTYSNLGTLNCHTYEAATGIVPGGTSSACTNKQAVTNWIGVTGGNMMGGKCHAIRLPVPWGIDGNNHAKVAPFAQLYVDMLVALQNHINTYVSAKRINGFAGLTTVIKLGGAMDGEDAEFSLLGGNASGSNTAILPPEAGATGLPPETNCPANIAPYWQNLTVAGYNPRIVEETWEFIANSVGSSFNVASTGILLNIDVHNDPTSTFPDIAFNETNTSPGENFSTHSYAQSADGPYLQDDIIFCDLIGTYALGETIDLELGGGNVGTLTTTKPYYAGFVSGSTGTCLTTGSHAHQPLTYSLTGSVHTQWGVEEDGLVPIPDSGMSSIGTYAHGAATLGLELSWGTNQSGNMMPDGNGIVNGDGGAACDSNDDGCSIYATSPLALCPTDGTVTCVSRFDSMLDSGLYRYGVKRLYNSGNPSYQMYMLYPIDLCNPYLWPGLEKTYAALNGVDLKASSLTGTYTDCSGHSGTFTNNGIWTLLNQQ
jgi:hypothetical protein